MKSDRAEIQFILVLFHWLKPLTDEGREETVVPRKEKKKKKTDEELQKMPHTSSPNRDSNPALAAGACLESRSANHYNTRHESVGWSVSRKVPNARVLCFELVCRLCLFVCLSVYLFLCLFFLGVLFIITFLRESFLEFRDGRQVRIKLIFCQRTSSVPFSNSYPVEVLRTAVQCGASI